MKKTVLALSAVAFIGLSSAFSPIVTKLVSKSGHIQFFSHTVAEDISANNYKVVSTLDPASGAVVFSVPMQSFEFEKALMQKHFNSPKFLDTKQFPKVKFKGTISNLSDIDFGKDGTYDAKVSGELSMHGVSKSIENKGTVTIKGGKVIVNTKMNVTLGDYNIAFKEGKPSTNIAKDIDVTVKVEFDKAG